MNALHEAFLRSLEFRIQHKIKKFRSSLLTVQGSTTYFTISGLIIYVDNRAIKKVAGT